MLALIPVLCTVSYVSTEELEFVNIKERQAFERGQDAEVVCEVQGNPGPKEIKWLKEKKGLDGTNSSEFRRSCA